MTGAAGGDEQPGAGTVQVDFYVLGADGDEAVRHFACRLAEKAWRAGNEVWIDAGSHDAARALDAELWTFREESFVPHAVADRGTDDTPVLIGSGDEPAADPQVLINLSAGVPDYVTRCARVAEIIGGDDASRAAGRERFRRYRALGYEPGTHSIEDGDR